MNPPVIRRIYEMSYLIGVVGFLRDTVGENSQGGGWVIGIILA